MLKWVALFLVLAVPATCFKPGEPAAMLAAIVVSGMICGTIAGFVIFRSYKTH